MAALLAAAKPWFAAFGDAAALAALAGAGAAVYLGCMRLWKGEFLSRALGLLAGRS
jgi:hypothetical protein